MFFLFLCGFAISFSALPGPAWAADETTAKLTPASKPELNPKAALNRSDTLIAGISAPQGVWLPYFHNGGWDDNATSPIFARLFEFDPKGDIVPELAEKYEISSDGLTYTFKLREGLKFQDGKPLTADDVAFTLTLLLDPAYNGYTELWRAEIVGGEEYTKGNADSVSGITVENPHTIVVKTKKVNAQTFYLLNVRVLSKAYYGAAYKKGNLDYLKALFSKPYGNGVYKLTEYVPGQEVRYVANPHYYAGKVKIENFIYKVTPEETKLQYLQVGDTDYDRLSATPEIIDQLKALGFLNVRVAYANSFGYAQFNLHRPYLQDKKVRLALIIALDRKSYVEARFRGLGKVANIPVSPYLFTYDESGVDTLDYNPERARQLLEEAGWKTGPDGYREKDGQKLRIAYLTRWSTDEIIPIAQENYKDIGVEFIPEPLDYGSLVARVRDGSYDLASFITSQQFDPNNAVQEYHTNAPGNRIGYSNAALDKLIDEGNTTLDREKRKNIYKKLYQEFNADPPIILLYTGAQVWAFNERVHGLNINDFTGIAGSYGTWSIKK
ncbi:MAG: ABC transporter substrate-binding protein [Synergistaceae bacterium]|nr:ABC transporter substrate-binding protein [Synergistaceae bacterium]